MSKFKVGDTVRYHGGSDVLMPEHVGKIGKVTAVRERDGYCFALLEDSTEISAYPTSIDLLTSETQPAIDAHYTKYAIQPMEFSLANGLDAAQHTVVKYTVRYRDKGGIRDLRAAIRVLELMIEREEKAQANG